MQDNTTPNSIPQAVNPAPPFLPRAVPPPIGDITTTTIDTSPDTIDLGTAERVPRLVLRNAPARDVLILLAKSAGLNLAFTANPSATPGQGAAPGAATAGSDGPLISLDIENEPVQDVFNYVIRLSGLQANRIGRTIFVGVSLPNEARNLILRNIRLNQVDVGVALNFLVGLGAETSVARDRQVVSVAAIPVGSGSTAAVTQSQTTTEQRIETQRVDYKDNLNPPLRGVTVVGDARTNSLSLIGSPRKVEIAVAELIKLDSRRRQVAVNVRIIDVDLRNTDQAGFSFSFGIDHTQVVNTNGVGIINFGSNSPAALLNGVIPGGSTGVISGSSSLPLTAPSSIRFAKQFLGQLQTSITNGNAKILTDPTVIVQEGQTANVRLTEEVPTVSQNVTISNGVAQTTTTVTKDLAGLILAINVTRVDDNGFVTLSVAPSIKRPLQTVTFAGGVSTTLLAERRVESGQVRMRDGQTLVLSGIIQDSDKTTVSKIPILGDLPLLGALFRSTSRDNERKEVVVLLTPQVLDDSERANWGYGYTPGQDARQLIQQPQNNSGSSFGK